MPVTRKEFIRKDRVKFMRKALFYGLIWSVVPCGIETHRVAKQ